MKKLKQTVLRVHASACLRLAKSKLKFELKTPLPFVESLFALVKNKLFITVFLLGYFSFFVVTVYILDLKKDGFGAGHLEYGFPFTYYYSHCFGGFYVWPGLFGNILFAAVLSIAAGLAATWLWLNCLAPFWRMVSSPEFRAKWYI